MHCLKISKTIIAVVFAVTITSCNKLLEIDRPRNTISTEKAFNSDASANAALAGMYTLLMDGSGDAASFSNGGLSAYTAMLADEVDQRLGSLDALDYEFSINKLISDNGIVSEAFWGRAYKVIYQANSIIEGVNASTSTILTDSARKQLIAEAKFGRAFSHFYLVNLFGDIPVMTTTDITVTANYIRNPVSEVYKQIEQDLKDAFTDLKDDYRVSANEKVRPNKWTAAALLSRVYLYQKKWAEAEATATSVITTGKYHTQAPSSVFLPNSDESIWQLKHEVSTQAGYAMQEPKLFVPPYRYNWLPPDLQDLFMDSATFAMFGSEFLLPKYSLTQQLLSAFETNDQRKVKWIDYNLTPNSEPYFARKYYYPCKYKNLNEDLSTYPPGYYTVFRISEQYLIRAEARAQQGNDLTGAANDINEIRTKNGLGVTGAASKEDLLEAVLKERRVEFMTEWGHRWFDLKRTGKASSVLGAITSKQPWSDNDLLMPIPAGEIQKNPRLTPNPGY